jgi:hypothetical protein
MAENNFYDNISTDGDTIFVIGPDEARLCVHSCLLQTASKVFRAMFGPFYSEGQRSDLISSKKEIPLPEDDADAMRIMCAVIHHRNDLIPGEMSSSDVLRLSVVADKYDCKIALKHATRHWLDHRNVVSLKEQMELMTAAYLLDHAQAFSAITYTMMMEHAGSYLPFAQDQVDFGVPWEIFCKSLEIICISALLIKKTDLLEVKRNSIYKQLDYVLTVKHELKDCSCGFKSRSVYSYLGQLSGEGLLPSPYVNRGTALDCIKKAEQMGPPSVVEDCKTCENYRWHRPACSRESMLKDLQGLKDGKGFCLNCMSGESPIYSEAPCSIKH